MAKLNYEKHKKHGKAYGSGIVAGTDTTWTLGTKHWGMSVRQLPLDYLCWASQKLEATNKHKIKADRELQRRYYKANATGLKNDPSVSQHNNVK